MTYATKWILRSVWSVKRADKASKRCANVITRWIQMYEMSSKEKTRPSSQSIRTWRRRSEASMAGSDKRRWLVPNRKST